MKQSLLIFALIFTCCATQISISQQASAQSSSSNSASSADEAFEPLRKAMHNLYQSLVNKGGIDDRDRPVLQDMLQRVEEFSRKYPSDNRGRMLELQLAVWLNDTSRAEAIYRRMLQADPQDAKTRTALAKFLKTENRYDDILDVLDASKIDPAADPEAMLTLSEALFAQHKFQESVDVLHAISAEALEKLPHLQLEFDQIRSGREEYVSLWNKEQELRQREAAADNLPRVMLVTSRGPILLELFEDQAPNTVANFIALSESGFYNTSKFHRVLSSFMAQGGDPNTKPDGKGFPGQGNPGYFIPDEHTRDDSRMHFSGSLAMAKQEAPNTAGSQFYITHLPTPHLNGKHTVFGRVVEGLDIARSIKQDDVIEAITVIRKRDHEYKPQTLSLTAAPPPFASPAPQPAVTDGLDVDDEAGGVEEEDTEE